MWLHPWFFSMRVLHLGQHLVFAKIQLAVSLSFLHLSCHRPSSAQEQGACGSSPHLRQKSVPHLHSATHAANPDEAKVDDDAMATFVQPGPGHHRVNPFISTKLLNWYSTNLGNRSGAKAATSSSVKASLQSVWGHVSRTQEGLRKKKETCSLNERKSTKC
jgi:hypothetical protein